MRYIDEEANLGFADLFAALFLDYDNRKNNKHHYNYSVQYLGHRSHVPRSGDYDGDHRFVGCHIVVGGFKEEKVFAGVEMWQVDHIVARCGDGPVVLQARYTPYISYIGGVAEIEGGKLEGEGVVFVRQIQAQRLAVGNYSVAVDRGGAIDTLSVEDNCRGFDFAVETHGGDGVGVKSRDAEVAAQHYAVVGGDASMRE